MITADEHRLFRGVEVQSEMKVDNNFPKHEAHVKLFHFQH